MGEPARSRLERWCASYSNCARFHVPTTLPMLLLSLSVISTPSPMREVSPATPNPASKDRLFDDLPLLLNNGPNRLLDKHSQSPAHLLQVALCRHILLCYDRASTRIRRIRCRTPFSPI